MSDWPTYKWVVFLIPFGLLLIGVGILLLLRRTFRTRLHVEKQIRQDPDINEWLVVFGWSRKVLYLPTVLASFVAAVIMYISPDWVHAGAVGGIWLGVFFLNFLIDEYEMSIKVILIGLLFIAVLLLWLGLLDWLVPFVRSFRKLAMEMSGTGYLILAIIFLAAIGVAWLRGLFYYVAITPNYMNIQVGPTETGEQISREEYSTRVDTGDFLERLLGFGRLVITFADQRRQPMMLLIGRIGKRASRLESIRGKLAFDRFREPHLEGQRNDATTETQRTQSN